MQDLDLEILELQAAKFVALVPGQKRPQGRDWQHRSQTVADLPGPQVGLLLGDLGGGLAAVDFDGPAAVDYYTQNVSQSVPDTVMWTSGRQGRFQIVLRVPENLRSDIAGSFAHSVAPGQQLEWRYARGGAAAQSVLPPSVHPELKTPYFWVPGHSPRDCCIQDLPEDILAWIQSHQKKQKPAAEPAYGASSWVVQDYRGEARTLSRILEIIAGMREGDRSLRACQVGGLMRGIRPELRNDILSRLRAAGCDPAAITSAVKYSQQQ